jgi:adenine-specific DNA methylase
MNTDETPSIRPRHAVEDSRLIEHAFPLKQASLDSVHEKNVRHGHISTLHIWPARRPLAACRAALIATLLPDPGTPEGRKALCEKIGGKLVKKIERKKMPDGSIVEREKEETEGGILHWGRETKNKADLEWFRQEIKKAYNGRAPKVLDPFAGGGAIPLEAMRLGCEATAVDINPVAWFILKCTLEYPQKLAGKTHPLPDFILENEEFMNAFYKAHPYLVGRTKKTKKQAADEHGMFPMMVKEDSGRAPKADLAWHVRAWGQWVLERARRDLARFYPTYADFEPLDTRNAKPYEKRPLTMVPLKDDGNPDIDVLNKAFSPEYLDDKKNPRWVAKTTVAYLWARTVKCKNCRATVPLLKTRWLCKKDNNRVLLGMEPNSDKTDVVFSIERNVPVRGGNAAQRRENDKRVGAGTVSRSGAKCPCCGVISTVEDVQAISTAGNLGEYLVCLIISGRSGFEFVLPRDADKTLVAECNGVADTYLASEAHGPIREPIDTRRPSPNARGLSGLTRYGVTRFDMVFNHRQRLSLGWYCAFLRTLHQHIIEMHYPTEWATAVADLISLTTGKLSDYNSKFCTWHINRQTIGHTFARYALPMTTDYVESNPIGGLTGGFLGAVEWVFLYLRNIQGSLHGGSSLIFGSADETPCLNTDVILTDPPYYDSIPYSDISDFFYIWLRRAVSLRHPDVFCADLVNRKKEFIQHAGRLDGDNDAAKLFYETGMAGSFARAFENLRDQGRFVVVFAHKQPDAWETLATAIMHAGFVVTASWPIQTEMPNKAAGGARLASSVWLVCRKRPKASRPGWDNQVLEDMRTNIRQRLREYWDAGIRGPDFVWAATGPAMEAYSKHPIVRMANEPGQIMPISDRELPDGRRITGFLTHVRRIVVDFVVGRVLSGDKEGDADMAAADRLDEVTAYYLLHRHDFGMDEAPAGACILYAVSCGISDRELAGTWDLIGFTKGKGKDDEEEEADADAESDAETDDDSGSKVKLRTWAQRKGKSLGYEAPGGKPIPLIDRVHCLMHLWKAGDLSKVDGYLDGNGLRRHELFKRLLQSLIELSPHGSEERSLMESISNHVGARGAVKQQEPALFTTEVTENTEEEQ